MTASPSDDPNFEGGEKDFENRIEAEDSLGESSDDMPGINHLSNDDDDETSAASGEDLVGKTIGPYKVLQKLGHGGMGEVYMADQEQPIRRRIALKVIKRGKDSKQVLARFEAERQALAIMNHENIAKVLDAGAEDGRPYFAMELVKGISITDYCDINKLDIDARLRLFVSVCKAVNHAHQKGIIHRDLKPSNILVEERDGHPIPKVIDFGLAKALNTQAKLTDQTYFTEFGRVVGTVHYMSPEQAEMNQLDVDTRTDVYSLGVILYELLTGTRPLDDETIRQNAFLKVLELIREQEAPKPSSRVSDASDTAVQASQRRRISTSKLQQMLNGDLDWIVLKALEKDRSRRYSGATEFGDDVENYLNGDPVNAGEPTFSYRLSKFVKKNQLPVAASAAFLLVILVGLAVTSFLAYSLNDSVKKEIQQRGIAETKSKEAEAIAEKLREQTKIAEGKTAEAIRERERAQNRSREAEEAKKELENANVDLERREIDAIASPLEIQESLFREGSINTVAALSASKLELLGRPTANNLRSYLSLRDLVVKRTSSRRLWQWEIAVSKDGKYFATGDLVTGKIRIWNAQLKSLVASWDAHKVPVSFDIRGGFWPTVSTIEFHPVQSNLVYSAGWDGNVVLWDHHTQSRLQTTFLAPGQQATTFTMDDEHEPISLIVGTDDGFLIRLDGENLSELKRAQVCESRISAIDVRSDGTVVAVGDKGTCVTCDAEFQNPNFATAEFPQLFSAVFSPSGEKIAVSGANEQVSILNAEDLTLARRFEAQEIDANGKIRCLRWTKNNQLITGGSDGRIKTWNSSFELSQSFTGHGPNVYKRGDILDFVTTDDTIFSIGRDHTVRIWDIESEKCTHSLQGSLFPHEVSSSSDYVRASFCPATNQLLVATDSKDAYARIWNLDKLTVESKYSEFPIANFIKENDGVLTQDVAISNDGAMFVVAEPTGKLTFWRVGESAPEKSVTAHRLKLFSTNPRLPLTQVLWANDDKRVFSLAHDYKLKIWDATTLDRVDQFDLSDSEYPLIPEGVDPTDQTEVEELQRSLKITRFDDQLIQNENLLITAGRDSFLRCWDLDSHEIVWRLKVGDRITAMVLSPDRKTIVVGCENGQLFRADIERQSVTSFDTYYSAFDKFAFAENEMFIDKRFGQQISDKWNQSIRGLAISPNGQVFAATNGHGVLSVYGFTASRPVSRAYAYENFENSMRYLKPIFTREGRLFTVGADRCVREWDLYHEKQPLQGKDDSKVNRLIADPGSGRMIQLGNSDRDENLIWTQANGRWSSKQLPSSLKGATDIKFIPDSDDLLVGTLNGKAFRYGLINNGIVREYSGPGGVRNYDKPVGVFQRGALVATSFSGRLAASTWSENNRHFVEIWDLETGETVSSIDLRRGVEAIAFHPSDNQLAVTDQFGYCRLYFLDGGEKPQLVFRAKGPQFATGLEFSSDGKLLFQSGQYYNSRILSVWDVKTGDEINPTTGLKFEKDDRNNEQDLFEAKFMLDQYGRWTVSHPDIAISPDGRWLVSAGFDGYLVLWEINDRLVSFKSKISAVALVDLSNEVHDTSLDSPTTSNPLQTTNVEFSHDSNEVFFASAAGPVFSVDVEHMIALAEMSPQERFEKLTRTTGLRLEESGRAETIEQNHLVPAKKSRSNAGE